MAKKMKKLLSLVLVLSMILSMGSAFAFADTEGADGTPAVTSGAADKTDADKAPADTTTGAAVTTGTDDAEKTEDTEKTDNTTAAVYSDVKANNWFYTEVMWCNETGLMTGVSTGIFEPATLTNRAVLVTTLYRMEGSPAVTASGIFSDVAAGSWYENAVEWAAANDIVKGYDGRFAPTATLTREDLVTMIYRYVAYKKADVSASAELSAFTDSASIGAHAQDAVKWAVAADVVKGVTDTTFQPKGTATRAQLAVILYRLQTTILADITDPDTPLAEAPVTSGGSSGGGGGSRPAARTYTVNLAGGTLAETPAGWTLNEDGTYSITTRDTVDVVAAFAAATRANDVVTRELTPEIDEYTEDSIDWAGSRLVTTTYGVNEPTTVTETTSYTLSLTADGNSYTAQWTPFTETETVTDAAVTVEKGVEYTEGTVYTLDTEDANLTIGVIASVPDAVQNSENGNLQIFSCDGYFTFRPADHIVIGSTADREPVVETTSTSAIEGYITTITTTTTTTTYAPTLYRQTATYCVAVWSENTSTVVTTETIDNTPEKTAQTVTDDAVAKVQDVLKGITGHEGAQLVTVEGENGKYAATLDTDAIMAGGAAFDDDVLNGLATKIGAALKEQFGGYTIAVKDNVVYDAEGNFNNTALKEALYDVASGFFYQLSKMEAVDGVYTYKTVNAVVTNAADNTDTYPLDLAINLKGDDVAKVQELAGVLEKHLAMTTMTTDEANAAFGTAMNNVPAENEYIVVDVEMPDKLMNSVKEMAKDKVPEGTTVQELFDSLTVGQALSLLEQVPMGQLIGSQQSGITTLVNTLNSNANLVNKVLSKVDIDVRGEDLITNNTFAASTQYDDAWQNLMASVNAMVNGSTVLNTTVGSYAVGDGTKYMVPVTVAIDLDSSLGFKATETVLVVMHIDFSTEKPVDPTPAEVPAEKLTNDVIVKAQEVLAGIKGNNDEQIVELTKVSDDTYSMALNADALQANSAVFTDEMLTGLATKVGEALKEFEGYNITVAGSDVFNADGSINNTGLKDAMYEVAQGFFYRLSTMKLDNGVYTYGDPITIAVANANDANDAYEVEVLVQLSGDDVARIVDLSGTLEKHLSMKSMSAEKVADKYGYSEGGEENYFVVGVEMPDKLMAMAAEMAASKLPEGTTVQELFDTLTVGQALDLLGQASIDDIVGSGADGIETIINTVASNENLINKVLDKVTVEIEGKTFIEGSFKMENTGDAWKDCVASIRKMVGSEIFESTVGSYRVGETTDYLVPVTVTIDLEKSLGFTATETVLVVMDIAV